MTLGSYLWGMRISTFFALAGWVLVVLYIDPEKSGSVGRMLFYGSAFLSLSGLAIIFFGWAGRRADMEKEESVAHIGVSFRQGILVSVLTIALLFFQENGVLTWWDGLLVAAGIFLIELFFLSRRR